jgi:hypothetical protein
MTGLRTLTLRALVFRWRLTFESIIKDQDGIDELRQAYGGELARRGYYVEPRTLQPVKVRRERP